MNFAVLVAAQLYLLAPGAPSEKIDTVVVLMMENRAFDHMLGFMKRGGPFGDERVDGLVGDECNSRSLANSTAECVATARSSRCLNPDSIPQVWSNISTVHCEPHGSAHYGSCYFFRGNMYTKWSEQSGKTVPGYPKWQFASYAWRGTVADPDAIMVPPKIGQHAGYYYFFKGSQYYKWDSKSWKVIRGYPRNISKGFPGMPNNVDAAHCEPEGSPHYGYCYFFKGRQYWKWDAVQGQAVDGFPKEINGRLAWPGMPTDIDGIMVPQDTSGRHYGYYYFFKGSLYWKWDARTWRAVNGYPKQISRGFRRLGASDIVCVNDKALDNCPYDPNHAHSATIERIFGCRYCTLPPCHGREDDRSPCSAHDSTETPAKMTGFAQSAVWNGRDGENEMSMWPPEKVPIITTLAKNFALFDRFFCSHPGPTYPNRQFVHSGTAHGQTNDEVPRAGFPQKTIFRQVEEAGLEWKMYYEDSMAWAIFLQDLRRDKAKPQIQDMDRFYEDAAAGSLPAYSFIEPRISTRRESSRRSYGMANHQHPVASVREGERLMKDVYEAVRNGPQWNSTLLIITYDEHGGFFDHVPPPHEGVPNPDGIATKYGFNYTRLGIRVPTIVISPWIEKGTLVHEPPKSQKPFPTSQWELSSIPSTVAKLLDLPGHPLTARTEWAATFEHLLTRSVPRADCPQSLPHIPPPSSKERERQLKLPVDEHARGVIRMLCDIVQETDVHAERDLATESCDMLGICLPRSCGEDVQTQEDFSEWSANMFQRYLHNTRSTVPEIVFA